MSNLNNEKQRALGDYQAKAIFPHSVDTLAFFAGYDAGVKAERERIRVLLVHELDDNNEIFDLLWDRAFPQEQEK